MMLNRAAIRGVAVGLGTFVALVAGLALADYTVLDSTGTTRTFKAFVCETTKVCPAHVLMNSAGTEIGTAGAPVRTDPTGTTTQPVSGTVGVTGVATAANQATEIASLASIDTKVGSPVPLGGGSSGMTPLKLAALSNTAIAIKASAGQLYKLYCYNPNATIVYIQVYNVAAAGVTVGTTAALQSYGIPATSSSGFAHSLVGDQYGTAISAAATTGAGNATAPGTAVDCNVSYN